VHVRRKRERNEKRAVVGYGTAAGGCVHRLAACGRTGNDTFRAQIYRVTDNKPAQDPDTHFTYMANEEYIPAT
jgi:hypothetical protein